MRWAPCFGPGVLSGVPHERDSTTHDVNAMRLAAGGPAWMMLTRVAAQRSRLEEPTGSEAHLPRSFVHQPNGWHRARFERSAIRCEILSRWRTPPCAALGGGGASANIRC